MHACMPGDACVDAWRLRDSGLDPDIQVSSVGSIHVLVRKSGIHLYRRSVCHVMVRIDAYHGSLCGLHDTHSRRTCGAP